MNDITATMELAKQIVNENPDYDVDYLNEMLNACTVFGDSAPCDLDELGIACDSIKRY